MSKQASILRLSSPVEHTLLQTTVNALTKNETVLSSTGISSILLLDCFSTTAMAESKNGVPSPRLYKDNKGWAVGHGFNWTQRNMTVNMADRILLEFISVIAETLSNLMSEWKGFPDDIKRILICIAYQVGAFNLVTGWPETIKAAKNHDLVGVKHHAADSKWARIDSPSRARALLT